MKGQSELTSAMSEKYSVFLGVIKALRLKQWTKNLLVLASAVFAGTFFEKETFVHAVLAFISFSFMSSTVYIINDMIDIEKDRRHPVKRHRPFASGVLSVFQGIILSIFLFLSSLTIAIMLNIYFVGVALLYFVLNLLYSFKLKHVVIIDVMIIAAGFVLRAVAGAFAVNGQLTSWFILCTLFLSLFLALGKRRHEMELFKDNLEDGRNVLKDYSVKLLDQLMAIVAGLAIMFYALYAGSENQAMLFTLPFVIYGIFRYYYLVYIHNAGGSPEEVLTGDSHILISVAFFGVSVVVIQQLS